MSASTGQNGLRQRLDFIGLDNDASKSIAKIGSELERHLPVALDAFYARLAAVPNLAAFFDGSAHMHRARQAQLDHWSSIAAGRLDDDYFRSATRIGLTHARIGLVPQYYIAGYALVLETLLRGVITDYLHRHRPAPSLFRREDPTAFDADVATLADGVGAVVKAVLLDVDLAITTYFDRLTAEAAAAQQASADQIAHAVTETSQVLRRIADGDLTARITASFDGELEQIKHSTNDVADRLAAIVAQLRQTSRALKSATGEILAGSTDLADRTTRQAASIEETSASMDRIATTVTENVARADEASNRIRGVVGAAEAGGAAMTRATSAMERITESAGRISGIVSLIDDIAFQTNLLALNASVEAARAGEAGKGFAVVAVEVRRLAQSAAEASSQIKNLIAQSQGEVRAGTGLVSEAATSLAAVVENIRQGSELTASIAEMSREQSRAIDEVNLAVRQMDEMTQHNAALVEETNAAIEQTEAQAAELDSIVDRFRIDDRAAVAPGQVRERRRA